MKQDTERWFSAFADCLRDTSNKTRIETSLSEPFKLGKREGLRDTSNKTRIETPGSSLWMKSEDSSLRDTSNKTRIETSLSEPFKLGKREGLRDTSNKTRIETHPRLLTQEGHSQVSEILPTKQGLKQGFVSDVCLRDRRVSEILPTKQGLKHANIKFLNS